MARAGTSLLLLLVLCNGALAFDKENHYKYAEMGVALYDRCAEEIGTAKVPSTALQLAMGVREEDDLSWKRLMNWHYAFNDRMPSRTWLGFATPHLTTIFSQRLDEFESAAKSACEDTGSLFEAGGRVLHYIQDMRVPAHVVPIHHGSVLGHDSIDSYCPQDAAGEQACSFLKEFTSASNPRALLDDLRKLSEKDTRDAIVTRIAFEDKRLSPETCTWEKVFWCDPAHSTDCSGPYNFGSYRVTEIPGGLDDRTAKSLCDRDSAAVKRAYEAFALERQKAAVRDAAALTAMTMRLLANQGCKR